MMELLVNVTCHTVQFIHPIANREREREREREKLEIRNRR
jgi:hypothetical protein